MKSIYSNLLDAGWTMKDIDEMDIFYYFDVLAFKLDKTEEQQVAYIDQIF